LVDISHSHLTHPGSTPGPVKGYPGVPCDFNQSIQEISLGRGGLLTLILFLFVLRFILIVYFRPFFLANTVCPWVFTSVFVCVCWWMSSAWCKSTVTTRKIASAQADEHVYPYTKRTPCFCVCEVRRESWFSRSVQ